ncbi:pilus assembly protein PilP [Pseudomonas sp. C27(2019)]|uniref:type IV pili methyl-accepting chemotaxis transducer N-terminal domain-containing protein n=1 Tax=Pseudomonas sp. C27(2019) TaxID=2604941 RepID=UPI001247CFF3|nr:type IV pili methyl-accepting chemotaxis transducer N-terminal domain-containing protein [Pseudomonas sp. C27(2019)]QEY59964.1 pilus assembly protein PilP [Pseudomonas sp. C27(2019)]
MQLSFRMPRFQLIAGHSIQSVILSLLTTALIITLAFIPMSASADTLTIDSAINKAGMQRMLSQRITKSYLLIGQDTAADKAQTQLDTSVALFEESLGELERFSPTAEITQSLQDIRSEWNTFRQTAISKPEQSQALSVIEDSSRLLELCEKNVQLFEAYSGKEKGELINISGRQRMLSQRIGMLYIAKSWQVSNEQLDKTFAQALNDFDQALNLLLQSPLNSDEINQALNEVKAQWEFSRSGFELGESDRYVPFLIQVTTESILKKMDRITSLYVAVDPS